MLTCRNVMELLIDYLEGDLPEETDREVAAHLAVCDDCARYVHTYRKTAQICRESSAWRLPEGLVIRLQNYLKGHRSEDR